MNEAIDELKENEFKDLYEEEQNIDTKEYVKDIVIESDFEILFPDEYINNVSERLSLYNELATLKTEDELLAFQNKLTYRFGALSKPVQNILYSLRIKWFASKACIEKLVMK